jgi:peptidyl-tRNA hydrolase
MIHSMFKWFSKSKGQDPDPPQNTTVEKGRCGETVQYLIVRQDLEMSHGKMAAQCSHASGSICLAPFEHQLGQQRSIQNRDGLSKHRDAFQAWTQKSFAKVVLRVKSREQLLKVCDKLDEISHPYAPIFDACRTELEPEEANGSTLTCIGLFPMFKDEVPNFIRKLQVYK